MIDLEGKHRTDRVQTNRTTEKERRIVHLEGLFLTISFPQLAQEKQTQCNFLGLQFEVVVPLNEEQEHNQFHTFK